MDKQNTVFFKISNCKSETLAWWKKRGKLGDFEKRKFAKLILLFQQNPKSRSPYKIQLKSVVTLILNNPITSHFVFSLKDEVGSQTQSPTTAGANSEEIVRSRISLNNPFLRTYCDSKVAITESEI